MGTREVTPSLAARWLALWLALVLPGLLAPPVSHADDARDAQAHFERAIKLYQAKAYEEALAEFQHAYQLSPRYQVLFNVAQVHYQLNEYAEALRAFESYLAQGRHELSAERRAFVQGELAELRERVGTLVVVTDVPGASVLLDDIDVGVTPLEPLSVDIGRHVVRVELAGHGPITRKVHITSGNEARLELVLAPPVAETWPSAREPVESEPVAHPRRRAALWTLGTATLVLGAAAGVSLAVAYRSDGELDAQLREAPPNATAVDDLRERVRRAALASDVLGATALAAAAGFVVALIATRTRSDDSKDARLTRPRRLAARLEVGPGSLAVRGTF